MFKQIRYSFNKLRNFSKISQNNESKMNIIADSHNYKHYIFSFVLSNTVYAISRAKNDDNVWIRFFSFWIGFPFTCITLVAVTEGSNKAYGVNLSFLD